MSGIAGLTKLTGLTVVSWELRYSPSIWAHTLSRGGIQGKDAF